MTGRPLEQAIARLAEVARPFNAAVGEAIVDLNRRLEEASRMTRRPAPVHDPMSTGHPGQLLKLGDAARVLPGYVGPVLTIAGVRARGWDVDLNPYLPTGVIIITPATLRLTAREEGDVELALLYAEHRRQAGRELRRIVIEHAGALGLDLRPFARITLGATR